MDDSSEVNEPPDAVTRMPSDNEPDPTFIEAPTASLSADANESGYSASTFYRRIELLGEGGLGRVWLAHDERVDREVAIKELHPKMAGNADVLARFYREADILAGLQHPNIAPCFHVGVDDADRPFLVMQRISGDTLGERVQTLRASGLDWSVLHSELHDLVVVLLKVCEGIAYAHSRGVIHRDLKPANVMSGKFGEVFVLDWGLGKDVGAMGSPDQWSPGSSLENEAPKNQDETAAGSLLGTLAFMAPEQASNQDVGPQADVFGLGGILHYILTGRPPREFGSGAKVDLLRQIATALPRPARQLNPAAPRPLEAIALKATALRPADRYESAAHMAAELRRWLAGQPVLAYREPLRQRLARWVLSHRLTVSVAALAFFTVVLGLVMANMHQWASAESLVTEELLETRDRVTDIVHGIVREVQLIAALMNFAARSPTFIDCLSAPADSPKRAAAIQMAAPTLSAFVRQQPHILDAVLVDAAGGVTAFADIERPPGNEQRLLQAARQWMGQVSSIGPGGIFIEPISERMPAPPRGTPINVAVPVPIVVGVPVRASDDSKPVGAVFMSTRIGVHGFQDRAGKADAEDRAHADSFYADHTGRIYYYQINTGSMATFEPGFPQLFAIFPELASLLDRSAPNEIEARHTKNNCAVFARRLELEGVVPPLEPIIAVSRPLSDLQRFAVRRAWHLASAAVLVVILAAFLAIAFDWWLLRNVHAT